MNWMVLGRGVRLAFFLRVPLLTLLLLAALGPVSQCTGAHALLGNLFDQQNDAGASWMGVFTVSFAAFLLAFTAITAINLTLSYGSLRFSDGPEGAATKPPGRFAPHFSVRQKHPLLTFSLGTLGACILIGTVIVATGVERFWSSVGAAVSAFVSAVLLTILAKVVQLAMTDPHITEHPPLLVFPADRIPFVDRWFDRLYCWPGPESLSRAAGFMRRFKSALGRATQGPFGLVAGAGQGYLATVTVDEAERLKLRSGHVFAIALAALAMAAYILIGLDKSNISARPAAIPALAYMLLFLIAGCWILSALAFFFDRYRFPLLLSVGLLAASTAFLPRSDHFFRVETPRSVPRLTTLNVTRYLTPGAFLAERARHATAHRLILVATPGGGIQAAAWTAKVLQELDIRFPATPEKAGFRNAVALISSVSGGSLGSLIYAASYAGNVRPECTAQNARASAIDEVAWGLTSPDFWGALFPLVRGPVVIDRGWALEQKWAMVNGLSREPACTLCRANPLPACMGRASEADTYLSDWAVRGAEMPALIFNSMMVERGQHVVFSTTRFPEKNDPRGIANFYDLYPDVHEPFDIRVNTAARLSASFPYVAPAARSNLRSPSAPDFHFVDGGYYDNLGIDSLIGWIAAAYKQNPSLLGEVPELLVVEIRHFNPDDLARPVPEGWGFQLFAPMMALLRMWNNAPANRDRNELNLFMEDSRESGRGPKIEVVTIPYCGLNYSQAADPAKALGSCFAVADAEPVKLLPRSAQQPVGSQSKRRHVNCADPPLSWKLTENQKNCIDDTWNDLAERDPNRALARIQRFLEPIQATTMALSHK